jgi:hypothetical protein
MTRSTLALMLLMAAGCVSPLNPEAGMPLPRDPGDLVVHIQDQDGRPIEGVWIYVEMPNNIGSTFQEGTPTRADGNATFYAVPAGTRRVDVKLPAGFSAGADGVTRQVDVLKGRTVTIQFGVVRG